MRAWLLLANLDDQLSCYREPGSDRGPPPLCALMGAGALAMDRARRSARLRARAPVMVPAALCFHLVILVTLNYAFLGAPLLLLMLDWSGLVPGALNPRRPAAAAAPRPPARRAA